MERSSYFVEVDGRDISQDIDPILLSIEITLTAKSRSDTCTVTLDDAGAAAVFPRAGAKIRAGIMRNGQAVQFEGEIDAPRHTTGRGQGDILTLSAKSAPAKGKLKERQTRHKDKGSLKDAASEFGKKAGISVKVDGKLGSIEREYWSMRGESFLAWGHRIAREVGATFKVYGDQAVFVPRGAGTSVSGRGLQTIRVERGVNLITSSMTPNETTPEFTKTIVRWYDRKEAKWKQEKVEIGGAGAGGGSTGGSGAERHVRWPSPDQKQAKSRADSNKTDSEREKGGGTVEIDGEPAAMPEANAILSGIRAGGIDGAYRIDSVTHSYNRRGGYTTSLTLKQPQAGGGATPGTDSRGSGQ